MSDKQLERKGPRSQKVSGFVLCSYECIMEYFALMRKIW